MGPQVKGKWPHQEGKITVKFSGQTYWLLWGVNISHDANENSLDRESTPPKTKSADDEAVTV